MAYTYRCRTLIGVDTGEAGLVEVGEGIVAGVACWQTFGFTVDHSWILGVKIPERLGSASGVKGN